MSFPEVDALLFDTFGTVVDWRGSIIRDLTAWGQAEGIACDWARLADLWRGRYVPQMARVRSGALPWTNLDELHDEALGQLMPELGLSLTPAQRRHVNLVWHRLEGWPDAVPGLTRLKQRFIIAPLSNGNVSLLLNMAKHAGLPWDAIFSAEHFHHYKPDPEVYQGAGAQLGRDPARVMMCAAHNGDLRAARAAGMRTAFIARPTEHGPGQTTDLVAEEAWDVVVGNIGELVKETGR
jgi:2-haloacid dehalogenase